MKPGFIYLLTAVLSLLLSQQAYADAPRIALITPDPAVEEGELLRRTRLRLRSELRAAGFALVELTAQSGSPREVVERGAHGEDAFAAVQLSRVEGSAAVDVWISDQLTDKTVVRRIQLDDEHPDSPATMALRVVELLQGSLMELELSPEPRSPPEVDRFLAQAKPNRQDVPSRWWLAAVASTLWSPSHRIAVGPGLRVRYLDPSGFGVDLSLSGPLWGTDVSASAGSASLTEATATFGASLSRELGASGWFWSPAFDAGIYSVAIEGDAEPGFVARSSRAWSAMLGTRFGLSKEFGSDVALGFDLSAGTLLAPVRVRLASAERGPLGTVLVGGSISLATAL